MFGSSADLSQGRVVIGAEQEASLATGVDGDQTNNDFPGSGAGYVFQ